MTLHIRSAGAAATRTLLSACVVLAVWQTMPAHAQDRLRGMPGYERYQRINSQLNGAVVSGALPVVWLDGGRAFSYERDGKSYRYDVAARKAVETPGFEASAEGGRGGRGGRGGGPARGRQFDVAVSPDSTHRAFYRDRNIWLSNANGSDAQQLTADGDERARIKYGTASWVYGEELGQTTAMWWSPDGKKLAFYRFDESGIPDYYLQLRQTQVQDTIDVEAYPKPGVPNPVVDLFVYDLATHRTVRIDVRDGQPFTNDVQGHYVYSVAWSPDGRELTFNRTNRRQNSLDFVACNPDSTTELVPASTSSLRAAAASKCRVIVHESWPTGWVQNHPPMQYLADGRRFLWTSERSGFRNLYLYDLSGRLLATLTKHPFEVANVVQVNEKAGVVWYMARDGDNFMKLQLHRVGLDGKGDRRLTDPAFNHNVSLAPNGRHFVDIAQTHDQPPVTRLIDADGRVITELAKSDLSRFEQLGLRKVEMFTYMAADGKTELHGMISFPSDFDPQRRYPVLVPVYGGPASASNTARETFAMPNPLTEYGFLVVNLDSRAVPGMGKRTLNDLYLKLGQTEINDMAGGVKALWDRPWVDRNRVGIYGTSYGGYSSVMAILRYPDVFAAAAASSPPTDWRNYDTIYTERYMWIPQENAQGYDAGSAMTYAKDLRGRLLLYWGTADNNVHPSNMMQLIQALQRAGRSFDLQVGPDQGHSGVNQQRMMEFFIENLILHAPTATN